MLYAIDDTHPELADDVFVAGDARVIGRVKLEAGSSVWFGCVLRGDTDLLQVGAGSNVQDLSVLHADPGFPLTIGRNVTVGHKVMLHGCTIADNSLIGIGAIVLNGARIGSNCIIGAGALIPEGKEIPDNSLVMGAPGKVVRDTTDAHQQAILESARHYVANGQRYRQGLTPLPDR